MYIKNNLIGFDNNLYLSIDSLIKINNMIANPKTITLVRYVNHKDVKCIG